MKRVVLPVAVVALLLFANAAGMAQEKGDKAIDGDVPAKAFPEAPDIAPGLKTAAKREPQAEPNAKAETDAATKPAALPRVSESNRFKHLGDTMTIHGQVVDEAQM